ncbi:unknown [Dialister sp. CAG:357]|nr:unknown [Dialister sp. CAG:357]
MVLVHEIICIRQHIIGGEADRIHDDAVFGPLHQLDFAAFLADAHVAVNDA